MFLLYLFHSPKMFPQLIQQIEIYLYPFCSFRLLLVQEVQSQFPAVTSLLFLEHISSQKLQPTNKMHRKYCTRVVHPFVPANAKRIDRQRSLSPVGENVRERSQKKMTLINLKPKGHNTVYQRLYHFCLV